jgi:hypothetical protein
MMILSQPDIWKRVYCISRRPQMNNVPDWFSSHAIDLFNSDAQGVAKEIKQAGIKEIDYAFFYAFMPVAASDDRTLFKVCGTYGYVYASPS